MAVNKVDVNGVTVLDLTQDSVTPATLKKGETAHDASGAAIVGEMESSAPSLQSKSVTYTANGTATVTPDAPYDGLSSVDVTVDVSGGGGGAGFKVTFPATAMNWNYVNSADLLLSNGGVKSFSSYSEVSGKTIENVVGIHCIGMSSYYVLIMTLSGGSVAQCTIGYSQASSYLITTSPNSTYSWYGSGKSTFWWPLADTVISKIEMYDTE